MKVARLYRFHPLDGRDANDVQSEPEYANASTKDKEEVAAMFRAGAKFYWTTFPGETAYFRVELKNFRFVVEVLGDRVETHEAPP